MVEDTIVSRYYEFSIPLATCVMELNTFENEGSLGKKNGVLSLWDIYLEKPLNIEYNYLCRKILTGDGYSLSEKEIDKRCLSRSKYEIEKDKIFKK